MFLSRESITKQLFHELLNFKTLALDPGEPADLDSGTLLKSSLKGEPGRVIERALEQLEHKLCGKGFGTLDEEKVVRSVLKDLGDYKKSSKKTSVHFSTYDKTQVPTIHPCSWLLFAPLVIAGDEDKNLNYEATDDFKTHLTNTHYSYANPCAIEETGLYFAVKTKNYEMVDAFLCPEFYDYHLNLDDLNKLLGLTQDAKTRMALYRHSEDLVTWISNDEYLQGSCVKSFEELKLLWGYLTEVQRKVLIEFTTATLWLDLLDQGDLAQQKIKELLGPDFTVLQSKLLKDPKIKQGTLLHKNLRYLSQEQQFNYLLDNDNIDINSLFPFPRGQDWNNVLSSLGYHQKHGQLINLRYVIQPPLSKVHNNLIKVLINLDVEASVIIQALKKIEEYARKPERKDEYEAFLTQLGKNAVQNEYATGFFIVNWFYRLLRYLKMISETPLHPYIKQMTQVISDETSIIPSDLMNILPPPLKEDYSIYKQALLAYAQGQIMDFWQKLPCDSSNKIIVDPFRFDARHKIINEPLRFEALLASLATPQDRREELFNGLDKESLIYFNTPKGLCQLVLETPSFIVEEHLPLLISAMNNYDLVFLDQQSTAVVELLLHRDEQVFNKLAPFLPGTLSDHVNLSFQIDTPRFQTEILSSLLMDPKEGDLDRFLKVYCANPNHFSALLRFISNKNNLLASRCWDLVTKTIWEGWYKKCEHAEAWSQVLKHLVFSDRLAFFDNLVSGGKLTANEFCDFLLRKDEALFNTLWSKIPSEQWTSWIKDNGLPLTTPLLLETMPFSFRVAFFEEMLIKKTAEDRPAFYVTADQTIEQFYPDAVKKIMEETNEVDGAKAELGQLTKDKLDRLNGDFVELIKDVDGLKTQLSHAMVPIITADNGWGAYIPQLFKPDPYYALDQLIKKASKAITKSHHSLTSDPLFVVLDKIPSFKVHFDTLKMAIEQLAEQTQRFDEIDKLKTPLSDLFNTLEPFTGVPPANIDTGVESEPRLMCGQMAN